MSKETIHINNYEAFYLDYLEGNLSPEQVVLLERFLDEHPELVEEDFECLEAENLVLDPSFKEDLKVFDSEWVISTANIEQFLIAEKEGVLSLAERQKLKDFLTTHPEFVADRKYYQLTRLVADQSLGYGDKSDLYRKKGLVLWPYWTSIAAAACVVTVLWLMPNDVDEYQLTLPPLAELNPETERTFNQPEPSINRVENSVENQQVAQNQPPTNTNKKRRTLQIKADIEKQPIARFSIDGSATTIPRQFDGTTFYPEDSSLEDDASSDYALSMNNPVEPITRKLSDIIKQPVEYQRGSNSEVGRKGFYLKIGKIEIYNSRKN